MQNEQDSNISKDNRTLTAASLKTQISDNDIPNQQIPTSILNVRAEQREKQKQNIANIRV